MNPRTKQLLPTVGMPFAGKTLPLSPSGRGPSPVFPNAGLRAASVRKKPAKHRRVFLLLLWACAMGGLSFPPAIAKAADSDPQAQNVGVDAETLAREATIYRDGYGVPHIVGPTDEACVFGFGYCQAEDDFWQIEDSFALMLGRSAELNGQRYLHHDLLNHAFEVARRSEADFTKLDDEVRSICAAYVAGLNHYLATHPDVEPRMFKHFEPWYVLAFARGVILQRLFPHTGAPTPHLDRLSEEVFKRTGSNAWAIGPSRTRSGRPMLMVNPHSPYFGYGQFYEGHLMSGEGWNFSGATFFGSPLPTMGHNEHCGWAFTVNEPNTSDAWIEVFDDAEHPLNYRYGDGYRTARQWTDAIRVRTRRGIEERSYTFRATHRGPVVARLDETRYVSAMIGRFYDAFLVRQNLQLVRARNLRDFRQAMAMQDFHYFNAVYADRHGDLYYVYNGIVPRREAGFDWTHPLDGRDPRTEWRGYHAFDELPQVTNPLSDFLQSCNSSPFTTTDDGNPSVGDFPAYMFRDALDDKRRAKRLRLHLRQSTDVTFEAFRQTVFDTTIYWALIELPRFREKFERLQFDSPKLAERVRPYLEHLLDWDCRGGLKSTQATLCLEWYEQLYGFGYPAETLKPEFVGRPASQFEALVRAAETLKKYYGTWRVPWGKIHRLQRHAHRSVTGPGDLAFVPFSDRHPSLPVAGIPGPPGVMFAMYFTPSRMPLKPVQKRYAVVGTCYVAAVEFTDRIHCRTLVQFGTSGDPSSPHFFDQAQLMSRQQLKPAPFYLDEVRAAAKQTYQPGSAHTATSTATGESPK